MSISNQQWRIIFGAITLGCTVLAAQPPVQAYPVLIAILVTVSAVFGFLKSPPDEPTPAE